MFPKSDMNGLGRFCLRFLLKVISISSFLKAHVHHYTHIDGMEMEDFAESLESLNSIMSEYEHLEKQMGEKTEPVPRLQIKTWYLLSPWWYVSAILHHCYLGGKNIPIKIIF